MKLPWEDRTGLAKAAAVLATGFCISLGLCGLNILASQQFHYGIEGSSGILLVTGFLEMAGMIVCGGGLVVVGLLFAGEQIIRLFRGPRGDEDQ